MVPRVDFFISPAFYFIHNFKEQISMDVVTNSQYLLHVMKQYPFNIDTRCVYNV